jgi:hypothetical protein
VAGRGLREHLLAHLHAPRTREPHRPSLHLETPCQPLGCAFPWRARSHERVAVIIIKRQAV